MRLDQFIPANLDGLGEAISWAYRLVRTGHNAWIIPAKNPNWFQVCYEHPRGPIESPAVGYRLQFHSDQDGFASPLWSINFAAGIDVLPGEKKS